MKLVTDAKALLSRSAAAAANVHRFAVIEQNCDKLIVEFGPTSYSQTVNAIREANSLIQKEGQSAEAERLCRQALKSSSLTGIMELLAQRILVEALAGQRKWQAVREAFSDFRQHFGSAGLHLQVIADFAHNVGYKCAFLALTERDQDAISLLGDVLDWPVISEALAQSSSGWPARLRLLTAIRDLAYGDHQNAEMIMKTVRPADLRDGTPEETRAWCMLWQMVRLAAFRVASRIYIHAND